MKLAVCTLLACLALAAADTDFYQQSAPAVQQQQPYYSSYSSNNYYDPAPQRQSLWDRVFGGNRRQGLAGLFGGGLGGAGGILGIFIAIAVVAAIGLVGVAYLTAVVSSGRGMDSDEWEVNHSVWMDQLQKDFEDSWSQ